MIKKRNEFLVCRKHRDDTARWGGKKFRMFWLGVMDYALDGKIPAFMKDEDPENFKELKEMFPRVKAYIDKKREAYDFKHDVISKLG